MNRKFRFDNLEICTNFKSENVLQITVEDIQTDEYFANETVQLMRIKKDTVFATLERKSQKNLKCTYSISEVEYEQIIEEDKRYLVLIFVVSFDYLPEFKEEIKLEYVEKKAGIKNISNLNFQVEIEELQRMISGFEKNGIISHQEVGGSSVQNENQLWKKQLSRGKYLLRVSGICTEPNGSGHNTLKFQVQLPNGSKTERRCSINSLYGYSYPFSFSELIDCTEGEVVVKSLPTHFSATLSGVHLSLMPIASLS